MVDINCEEGQEWQDEKKGVCKMIMKIGTGSYLCTGSVINNTSGKLYPYILTAHHCLVASKETATNEELEQFLFYFNYEKNTMWRKTPNQAQNYNWLPTTCGIYIIRRSR